jgi:hypothetical protein
VVEPWFSTRPVPIAVSTTVWLLPATPPPSHSMDHHLVRCSFRQIIRGRLTTFSNKKLGQGNLLLKVLGQGPTRVGRNRGNAKQKNQNRLRRLWGSN